MGIAKAYMMEMEEGGLHLYDVDQKFVCSDCVTDQALKEWIKNNAEKAECDYCGKTFPEHQAASVRKMVLLINESIFTIFDIAENWLSYESREGGWQGETFDIHDILQDIADEGITENETLYDEVIKALGDRSWCLDDPYRLPPHEQIKVSWEIFCRMIKHERRFFILDHSETLSFEHFLDQEGFTDVKGFLEGFIEFCENFGLIKTLPKGIKFFRCRAKSKNDAKIQYTHRALGPPPKRLALQPNRMSPVGIPMFYGAREKETALLETANAKDTFAIGQFEVLRDLNVLDLSELPEVPSVFDEARREFIKWAIFMHDFMKDFKKPISRDDRAHLEYVPTQIITEYFRTFVKLGDNPLDGIVYESAKQSGKKSIVLFATNKQICRDPAQLKKMEQWRVEYEEKEFGKPWLKMVGYVEEVFDPKKAS